MADLSALQREVLQAFFAREKGFFLTGGAALTGFYLHHRPTDDLDLFTDRADAFERGPRALGEVAASLGAKLEVRMDSPDFKRYALARGADLVVVDLVHDRVPQLVPNKAEIGGVRIDPVGEILANKLTTLVSRQEERDLVDVYFLEQAGHCVDDVLPAALAKDGGCTPANLAWLLSQVAIPDGLVVPAPLTTERLRAYVGDLVKRLRRAALPG
jgi:predicted nucleotidyltransferase component of viral defense system